MKNTSKEFIKGMMKLGETEESARKLLEEHIKKHRMPLSKQEEQELIDFINNVDIISDEASIIY